MHSISRIAANQEMVRGKKQLLKVRECYFEAGKLTVGGRVKENRKNVTKLIYYH